MNKYTSGVLAALLSTAAGCKGAAGEIITRTAARGAATAILQNQKPSTDSLIYFSPDTVRIDEPTRRLREHYKNTGKKNYTLKLLMKPIQDSITKPDSIPEI